MVKARAYAADQLFATLDTTTRQMYLAEAEESVSLSDTVGFIRDLPHGLVDAFQATLQEAIDADLLLHVVDASNPGFPNKYNKSKKFWVKSGPMMCPRFWFSTSWMPLSPSVSLPCCRICMSSMARRCRVCLSVLARGRAGAAAADVG
jgi:hypothetical protein